jgi:hypothetical protein
VYNINTFINFCRFVGFDIISYLHYFRLLVISSIVRRPEFICSTGGWLGDNWELYLRDKLRKSKCLIYQVKLMIATLFTALQTASQRCDSDTKIYCLMGNPLNQRVLEIRAYIYLNSTCFEC